MASNCTPSERSQLSRSAALTRWAHEDTTSGTAKARAGFRSKFEREVDPDGVLPPAERAIRAERLKKAHMGRLGVISAQKRRGVKNH